MTNWRQSPEYHRAIEKAFAPYQACLVDPEIDEAYYICALCGRIRERIQLNPCHIFKVKPYPMLRTVSENIISGCAPPFPCHFLFDLKGTKERKAIIEEKLPGRIAELEATILEKSNKLEEVGK